MRIYTFFPRDCRNVVAIGQQIKSGQAFVTMFSSYSIYYFCILCNKLYLYTQKKVSIYSPQMGIQVYFSLLYQRYTVKATMAWRVDILCFTKRIQRLDNETETRALENVTKRCVVVSAVAQGQTLGAPLSQRRQARQKTTKAPH